MKRMLKMKKSLNWTQKVMRNAMMYMIVILIRIRMRGNGRRGGLLGHSQSRQLPVQDEPNDQLDQSTQGQPQVPSRSTGRSAPDPEGSTASTQHRAIPPPPPPPPITPSSEPAIGSTSGHEGHSVGAAPISSMDGLSLTTFGRKKRIKLINGTLHPSEECAKKMKNIFKERMDPEGHCWKTITPETKEFYWDEFQKYFDWQEVTPLVKEA
ncbi:uncharacterized protein LOC131183053 [Hevea brasiliensis]|nr:uncharacterized protein LOC131183053 [Hevea brasiliensis]